MISRDLLRSPPNQQSEIALPLAGQKNLCLKYQRGGREGRGKVATHADQLSRQRRERDVATLPPLKISRIIKISFSARDNYSLKKSTHDHVRRVASFMLIIPSSHPPFSFSSTSTPLLLCKSAAFYVYPRAGWRW